MKKRLFKKMKGIILLNVIIVLCSVLVFGYGFNKSINYELINIKSKTPNNTPRAYNINNNNINRVNNNNNNTTSNYLPPASPYLPNSNITGNTPATNNSTDNNKPAGNANIFEGGNAPAGFKRESTDNNAREERARNSQPAEANSNTDVSILNAVGSFLNGIIGIIFWVTMLVPKIILLALVALISAIITGGKSLFAMPDVIFFNKVEITNLMMFISPVVSEKTGTTEFVVAVSTWFRIFYLVAVGLLFLILIYIAIRALMSSLSQNLAEVKEMLTNWIVSVFILAMLSFIIAGTILLNNFLLDIIRNVYGGSQSLHEQGTNVVKSIFSLGLIQQITGMIMAGLLIRQTVTFLITYIRRVIKIAFFIIIAPFIAVSYTMDKMKDKKAQALSYWNKQFIMTVLIQPFHAILFIILMTLAQATISSGANNGILGFGSLNPIYLILVVLILNFIEQAEKELAKLFDLSGGITMSEGKKLANALIGVQAVKTVSGLAKNYAEKRDKRYEENREDEAREKAKEQLANRNVSANISQTNRTETTVDARNNLGFNQEVTTETVINSPLGYELDNTILNDVQTVDPISTGNFDTLDEDKKPKISGIMDKTKILAAKSTKLYANNIHALTAATLGVSAGAAGGFDEMAVGGTLGWMLGKNLGKNKSSIKEREDKREKQLGKYTSEVEKEGEVVRNQLTAFGEINGVDMNNLTQNGRENIQAYFDILKEKIDTDRKSIDDEFKKSLKAYKSYLMNEQGKTVIQADQEARKILNDAKAGRLNTLELDNNAAKDYASAAIGKSIADSKKDFEENKFSLIKGSYDDVEKEVLSGTKTIQEINKEWEDAVKLLGQNDFKLIEDKEKELKEIEKRYKEMFENKAKLESTVEQASKNGITREQLEEVHEAITKEYKSKVNEYRGELEKLGLPEVDRYMDNMGVKRNVNRPEFEKELKDIYVTKSGLLTSKASNPRLVENILTKGSENVKVDKNGDNAPKALN